MNRNRYLKNRNNVKTWFWRYKSKLKCSRCGETHPAVLEFHHTDPHKKDSTIANMVRRGLPIFQIKKEIRKCIVLCSNCHKKHHYDLHLSPDLIPNRPTYYYVKKIGRTNSGHI